MEETARSRLNCEAPYGALQQAACQRESSRFFSEMGARALACAWRRPLGSETAPWIVSRRRSFTCYTCVVFPHEDESLFGWDPTPGIVSVWASAKGEALVWRRSPETLELTREEVRYRPWMLLRERDEWPSFVDVRTLDGPGELRYLVSAEDGVALESAVLVAASRRRGARLRRLSELGPEQVLQRPPEEQYLIASGRGFFHGLAFDQLRRLQFDLETTGLDPERERIFLIALRDPEGTRELLEITEINDAGEAELLRRFAARLVQHDPDVIENHNLHGFDLPFLVRRAARLRVPLLLGRSGPPGLSVRPSSRGIPSSSQSGRRRRLRYSVVGRELIDSMDAVLRYDFAARELPGHGLKEVARHFGLAGPERELIAGANIYKEYRLDPERVRRYALDDVEEAAALARLLGGASFALARLVPRRYDRLADAGAATGILEPLLLRAYLRAGQALPIHETGDGTPHTGAALHLFASGVGTRIVKADVASLYPSLMREHRIGPKRDRLEVLLRLVDRLVELRLAAKERGKRAPLGSPARFTDEALSSAMKIVVNSAYGYLGAGSLTRFSDVHAANEVTRQGRETLALLCRELERRGVTLLEADTDGVYFSVPSAWTEVEERRVVAEVNSLLPELVQLEFEGRYRAMLSHEPKNYALLGYDGKLILRGVAFRSRRSSPYGEVFLQAALPALLQGDLLGVRRSYVEMAMALRQRRLSTSLVASLVRLTKTPDEYARVRALRRELPYEALLNSGRAQWTRGERVRVYRAEGGRAAFLSDPALDARGSSSSSAMPDPRDYDVEYYFTQLRTIFASKLQRALDPETYAAVFEDPTQPSLFEAELSRARPLLTVLSQAASWEK